MSNYEIEIKQKQAYATRTFKNFIADPVVNDEQFFIVDWHNENGSNEYAIRYILDIKKGNFIITGDAGDCIASWYNKVTPDKLKKYLESIGYYISKIQISFDKYTYNMTDIKEDLDEIKKDVLRENPDLDIDKVNEDFDNMLELIDGIDYSEEIYYPDELIHLFEEYNEDWYESDFVRLGKRISQRVVLWTVGFQMACEQLGL